MDEINQHEQRESRAVEADEETRRIEALRRSERAQVFATRITRLANEAVSKRSPLETRWLADLRQYEGQYDPKTEAVIRDDPTRSGVFINITRRNVNAAEARIVDMLFPTDDRNWGIEPTPDPKLAHVRKAAEQDGNDAMVSEIDQRIEAAEKAAEGMQRKIDDQLTEAGYNSKARDVIHDCVLFGTGVIKGPVVVGRTRKAWHKSVDESGNPVSVLEIVASHEPTVQHVSIWNFFPDPNATTLEDCGYILERHYMTKRQLGDLLKVPGFFHEEIMILLKEGPNRNQNDNGRMAQMRAISGLASANYLENRYEVWEYHGPVEREELEALGIELDDEDQREFDCIVFVCNNRVIKATINPMETNEWPYSAVPFQKDEASIFGRSLPTLMRDQQDVVNAAWRTLIENMGLSSGDQIVIDRRVVKPADGNYRLMPRKVWYKNDPNTPISAAFATFPIQSHQAELMNIVEAANKISDEETNMPRLMYGETPGAAAQTMGGMAMMMNQANVVLRRMIKNWDDHVTRPLIQRFYDFNMQFSDDETIKGDFSVKARGSSALLVKEQQAQALMQFYGILAQTGVSKGNIGILRKIAQSLHLDADDILPSDDELEAQAQQQQPQDPQTLKVQAEMQLQQAKLEAEMQMQQAKLEAQREAQQIEAQLKERELQTRLAEAQAQREIAIMRMATEKEMTIEQINAKLNEAAMKHDADWKRFLGEAEIKARFGSGI